MTQDPRIYKRRNIFVRKITFTRITSNDDSLSEMLKRSRGIYTERQVQRCAEMSGAYGKDVSRILAATTQHHENRPGQTKKATVLAGDVLKFTKIYGGDGLLSYVPGRSHRGMDEVEQGRGILLHG